MTTPQPAPPKYDLTGKSVLLINPPWEIQEDSIWKSVASCYPNMGLAMLAAYLEHCGAQVKILDLQAVPTQSLEGLPTGDEGHRVPGGREPPTEVAPDTTDADDAHPHAS